MKDFRIPPGVLVLTILALLVDLLVIPGGVLFGLHHATGFLWEPWITLPLVWHSSAKDVDMLLSFAAIGGAWWVTRGEWSANNQTGGLTTGKFRATQRELVQGGWTPWPKPLTSPPPTPPGGLVLGLDQRGTGYLLTNDEHTIIIGSTGSRKTSNIILPSIGVLGRAGESLIVTDPKGELVQTTGAWLQDQGYQVIRHDYRFPTLGQQYNPMDGVIEAFHPYPDEHGDTPDPDWMMASQRATQLADAIVGDQVGSEGPMWKNWNRDLIAAAICAVADLGDPEARHLASVANLLTGEQDPAFLDQFFSRFASDHPARLSYASIRNSQSENRASILSTTGSHVGIFRQGAMAWMMARSDYALADLGRRKMAVFLVFPPNDPTFYKLITLYLQQMIRSLSDLAFRSPGRRMPVRVNGLLDEFGSFPSIPAFEGTLATCRSEGLRLNMVIQSYAQLASHYDQGRDKILRDNCSTTIFLSSGDLETAQQISGRLGQITVKTHGQSFDRTKTGQMTETVNETTRALLTPDQITTSIKPGTNLIMQLQHHPTQLTMHRVTDYQAFAFHETPDNPPPVVKTPPLWPSEDLPSPDDALDPVAVTADDGLLPDDAIVVGRDWADVLEIG